MFQEFANFFQPFTNLGSGGNSNPHNNNTNGKPPPASKSAIDGLPLIKLTADDLIEETNKECLICLCEQEIGTFSCKMPCGHIFHKPCLADWLMKQCTCPVCRYEIATNSYEYERVRKEKMKSRRVRVGIEELKRKKISELKSFCQEYHIDIHDCYDKHEIIDKISKSNHVTVVEGAPQVEITESEFQSKSVSELKKLLLSFGIPIEGALEKADLRMKLVESGRILLLADEKEVEPELEVDPPRPKIPSSSSSASTTGNRHEKAEPIDSTPVPSSSSSTHIEKFTLSELEVMSLSRLRELCQRHGVNIRGCLEKREVVEKIQLSPFSVNFVHREANTFDTYVFSPSTASASSTSSSSSPPVPSAPLAPSSTSSHDEFLDALRNSSLSKLWSICKEHSINTNGCLERADIVDRIVKSGKVSLRTLNETSSGPSSPLPSSSADSSSKRSSSSSSSSSHSSEKLTLSRGLLQELSFFEIRSILEANSVDSSNCSTRGELIERLEECGEVLIIE